MWKRIRSGSKLYSCRVQFIGVGKEAWIAAVLLRWKAHLTGNHSFVKMNQSEQIPDSFEHMLEPGARVAGGQLDWCTPPNVVQHRQLAGAGSELGAKLETHPIGGHGKVACVQRGTTHQNCFQVTKITQIRLQFANKTARLWVTAVVPTPAGLYCECIVPASPHGKTRASSICWNR